MKKTFVLMLAVFILLALVPQTTFSQATFNTTLGQNYGYYSAPIKVKAAGVVGTSTYLTGTPSTAETTQTFRAPYTLVSVTYSVADTIRDTIYVEQSVDSGSTWSVVATKALNCTDYLTPVYYEEVLRDGDSDVIDGVVGLLRIRHKPAATACGSAGSRAKVYLRLNWQK